MMVNICKIITLFGMVFISSMTWMLIGFYRLLPDYGYYILGVVAYSCAIAAAGAVGLYHRGRGGI